MFRRFRACALSAAALGVTLLSAGQADASSASAAGRLLHGPLHFPAYALASGDGTAEQRQETASGPEWLALAELSDPKAVTAPTWVTSLPLDGGEVKGQGNNPKPSAFSPGGVIYAPQATLGQGFQDEVEPNDTAATASPLTGTNLVVRASIFPNADVDFFSFNASAGDRIHAAVMTSFSANGSATATSSRGKR